MFFSLLIDQMMNLKKADKCTYEGAIEKKTTGFLFTRKCKHLRITVFRTKLFVPFFTMALSYKISRCGGQAKISMSCLCIAIILVIVFSSHFLFCNWIFFSSLICFSPLGSFSIDLSCHPYAIDYASIEISVWNTAQSCNKTFLNSQL